MRMPAGTGAQRTGRYRPLQGLQVSFYVRRKLVKGLSSGGARPLC